MAFLRYFLIRVAILVPLIIVFYWLGLGIVVSVIAATLIAFCVAYLFFRPQRDAAADSMREAVSPQARKARAQKRRRDLDAAVEDEMVEAAAGARVETRIENDRKPASVKAAPPKTPSSQKTGAQKPLESTSASE
ncbi:DUF4229 domain-containing protein [Psychromicrobium xiongbiense]|uniref:DUF4229 domain-containing protein n=1 Tax=Psychromicrobium xiongbiense TaxID=3051184 RepID=UPI002555C5E2|nr:DUF4229 domain-containing protein [Psychromicrobium sp. YIM S02556]